ncbi:MAG: pantoate--beta-alanine ligase [Pseudomonadota bacterium]|nr:pantoate--beta-alanine ligase [Pseudomonadota bacterium]
MSVDIVRTVAALRGRVAAWRAEGAQVAVVPTMGALHEGHLSLVREGMARAGRVIVTLFVNPKQFNSAADLAAYPRTEVADAAKLSALEGAGQGRLVLFAPDGDEMYPRGFATGVTVSGVSEGLCGAGRPGHFDGVATVVSKLLLIAGADVALFGEKDFQQLQVVRRLAADLNLPTEIVGCPTVREPDGLALSSRNVRLSAEERGRAAALPRAMLVAAARLEAGTPLAAALAEAEAEILAAGFARVEYLELRGAEDLAPLAAPDRPARLLAAAWMGEVRLIDNVPVAAVAGACAREIAGRTQAPAHRSGPHADPRGALGARA